MTKLLKIFLSNYIKPLQGFRSKGYATPGWRRGLFRFSHFVAKNVQNKVLSFIYLLITKMCINGSLKEGWPDHFLNMIQILIPVGVVDCLFKFRIFSFEGLLNFLALSFFDFKIFNNSTSAEVDLLKERKLFYAVSHSSQEVDLTAMP